MKTTDDGRIRKFETGATRDTATDKFDYEGFLAPQVLKRFAEYMHKHRQQSDGSLRDSDNWQKGIPLDAYMKSAWRHFMDWWTAHREGRVDEEALCALLFNVQGYLFEVLRSSYETSTQYDLGDLLTPEVVQELELRGFIVKG